jgi:ribosomal peptide maturation radical SAM protein 1
MEENKIMPDICLVSMPFAALDQPSIGNSLLTAAAKREGFSIKSFYPSFQFAKEVGLKKYTALNKTGKAADLLGEWIFSQAAFPELHNKDNSYFRNKLTTDKDILDNYFKITEKNDDVFETFYQARQQALPFIEKTAENILKFKPRIIGCSSNYQQHCSSLALLRVIKERNPAIITLLGGANCEASMGQAAKRNFPWVDFVVSGEADLLFPGLCHILLEKGKDIGINDLPFGVISDKNSSKEVFSEIGNSYRATVDNLNDLPIPDYDDYFEQLTEYNFEKKIFPSLIMETSRGCWWAQKKPCTFCGLNGCAYQFRTKTPQRILNEFNILYQKYKINKINKFIITDNVLSPKYFKSVLPALAGENKPSFFVHWEARANLNEEQVKILANSGARCIQIGIESLHDECLKLLNKGVTAIQNIAVLKFAMENGIRIYWNFLYEILGEKNCWYKELAKWLPLVYHLQPPGGVSQIFYSRFSDYHNNSEQYKIDLVPFKEYFSIYPLNKKEMKDIAFYFEDTTHIHTSGESIPKNKGINIVKLMLNEWEKLFKNYFNEKKKTKLVVWEEENQSFIIDTRPCATEENITLQGLERYVYYECRKPRTKKSLFESLKNKGFPNINLKELDKSINYLSEKKLILILNEEILSLAIREPARTLLTNKEFQTGNIELTYILDSILQDSFSIEKERED